MISYITSWYNIISWIFIYVQIFIISKFFHCPFSNIPWHIYICHMSYVISYIYRDHFIYIYIKTVYIYHISIIYLLYIHCIPMNPLTSFPHKRPSSDSDHRDADGQGGGHQDAPLKITSTQRRKKVAYIHIIHKISYTYIFQTKKTRYSISYVYIYICIICVYIWYVIYIYIYSLCRSNIRDVWYIYIHHMPLIYLWYGYFQMCIYI